MSESHEEHKESLEESLKERLASLLSAENMKNNRYLLLRCTPKMKVKLADLAEERSVKAMTQDHDLIARCLEEMPSVQFSNGLVGTGLTPKRNILIVKSFTGKEVPEATKFFEEITSGMSVDILYENFGFFRLTFLSEEVHEEQLKKVFEQVTTTPFQERKLQAIIDQEDMKGKLLARLKIERPYSFKPQMAFIPQPQQQHYSKPLPLPRLLLREETEPERRRPAWREAQRREVPSFILIPNFDSNYNHSAFVFLL